MSGNSVKAGEGSASQITYSQQTGFPTIAPAPQQTTLGQGHQGIMSTHQGQFQVISSPPYGTSGAAQNAASATTQYIPQFATYNQQGQLVISPSNFPASAYGQHQIFLTAAPGMQQAQQTQQQAVQQQQVQQQQAAQHQQQQSNHQGGSAKGLLTTTQGNKQVTVRGSQTYMFANTSPLMTASQPGLFTSLSSNEAKNDSSKQGQSGLVQQNTAGATTAQAHQGSFIMHNGIAYMNPQHQQAILSSNGQIILRAPTSHETTQQPIMFSPSALTQQSHIQSPGATNQQQGQQQAGQQLSLAPPTLQPMSLSATNTAGTIRHVTTNSNNVSSSQSGAPPGKTAISRALPTILPTTNVRPTYTLPQIPVSQASLQVNHQQQSSPKSKNKFSPRGGMGSSAGRQQPGKGNSSVGGATANSILKPSMVQQRGTPPGTGTIMSSSPSPLSMGPPILSQQQPPVNSQSQTPVNSHSQPPTLQPMLTVASGGVSTTRTQLHSQYPSLITSAPSPSSGASATVLVSTSSTKTSSWNNNTLIKAKPPTSTPPPVSSSLNPSTTNGVTESGSVNNGTSGGRDTPKAFVKPNVLTHVIDGHIIQESSQPFSLEAGDDKAQNPGGVPKKESLTEESFSHKKHNSSSNSISSPATTGTCVVSLSVSSGSSSTPIMATTTATTTSTKSSTPSTNSSVTTGTTTHAEKKRGPGRPSGSTRQNIDNQRNPGSGNNQSSKGNNHHIKDGSGPPSEKRRKLTDDPIIKPLPLSTSNSVFGKNGNPLKWSVQQVCDFVKSLHGCAEYVEDFMLQEIDGHALMLLKTEHLMAAMSIKLGPALKICSAINEMLTFKLGSTTVGRADLVEESKKDHYYIKDDDARQR
ncbi:PHC1 [Lepeophtheirus salmonis]|uniref:PHC1 n=1 Tax=Lepeophtheirus salmonis TaxID=72036 RepID=A0A817FB93_LEPSM|nr:PHC1 [Lepeophtheirus salmonis]CAG9477005.1 PHC1 [Lepeophtheirus salmonis]